MAVRESGEREGERELRGFSAALKFQQLEASAHHVGTRLTVRRPVVNTAPNNNVTNIGNTVSPNPAAHTRKTTRNTSGTTSTGAALLG